MVNNGATSHSRCSTVAYMKVLHWLTVKEGRGSQAELMAAKWCWCRTSDHLLGTWSARDRRSQYETVRVGTHRYTFFARSFYNLASFFLDQRVADGD